MPPFSASSSLRHRERLISLATLVVLVVSGGCSAGATNQALSPSPPAPARPVRYMPLGDSITDGYGIPGAYRTVLWQQLVETDHDRIDFVGSLHGGPPALRDQDHQGLVGWCIDGPCRENGKDDVIKHIDRWVVDYQPDIISIHLGTNDLATGSTGVTTAERLDHLVAQIYTARPGIFVVLVQPIPMAVDQAQHDAYVSRIPLIAADYRDQGRRIAVADLSRTLTLPDDYRDRLHPTQQGFDKMGLALAPVIHAAYLRVA